ncbi:MAG: cadherin-like domain-containing protein [Oscillatoriales cyanobacterium C42_A2020_001]|nr:cadherin-like domain-containing protein [Leptolyngbyaceae cyanobacterium C42_A2020_001]
MNCFDSSTAFTQASLLNNSISALNTDLALVSKTDLHDPLTLEFHSSSSSEIVSPPVSAPLDPFVVTSTADVIDANDGVITLREAITAANAKAGTDTISFNLGAGSHTITLTNGQLEILDHLTINGLGATELTISGNQASRVFQVGTKPIFDWGRTWQFIPTNAPTVTLTGMTIANGAVTNAVRIDPGGGILNYGNLTVTNSTIQNNFANGNGGGIYNQNGTLKIIKSIIQQNTAGGSGGGIENDLGKLEVISSTVSGNTSNGIGGGITSINNLTVIGSTIVDNYSGTNGGGIYAALLNRTTTIKNTTIARNTASLGTHDVDGSFTSLGGNQLGLGGNPAFVNGVKGDLVGTANARLQPLLNLTVDTLVDELDTNFGAGDLSLREALTLLSPGGTINFAGTLSGTITLNLGELALEKNVTINGLGADRLTISGNQQSRVMSIGSNVIASLSDFAIAHGFSQNNGGGIRMNIGSEVTLQRMMMTNSTAGNLTGGGAIWNDRGSLTILNSTLSGNQAGFGGAILNGSGVNLQDRSSTVTLKNSILSGNQAMLGGAILNQIGTLNLTSSTVSGNTGTGIMNGDRAVLHNSIIAGNSAASGSTSPDLIGNFLSRGYNLIGDGTGATVLRYIGDRVGTAQARIDAKLGTLQNNGGIWTMAPLPGSPVINAGDPTLNTELDQRGVARSQGGRADIGAVEWVNLAPIARNDSVFFRGRSVIFNVLANDFSPDGDNFQITSYTQPQNGTLTRNADGSFTYLGQSRFQPIDSFSYIITDENGASSTATVTLRGLVF